MLCGLTRLASRIKMAWWVLWHPKFHCKPQCLWCKYFEMCHGTKEALETIFGEPFE